MSTWREGWRLSCVSLDGIETGKIERGFGFSKSYFPVNQKYIHINSTFFVRSQEHFGITWFTFFFPQPAFNVTLARTSIEPPLTCFSQVCSALQHFMSMKNAGKPKIDF